MKTYENYLFDADGTLVDTIDLIVDCFSYITARYAGRTPPREVIVAGIGTPLVDQLTLHLGREFATQDVLDDYLAYQLRVMGDRVALFPGIAEGLRVLRQSGKKLAVVTARRRFSLEIILRQTGIAQFFDVVVTPEDTGRHKPDPQPALLAMARLGADPAATVMIGDAVHDISCGAAAGIDTVFVGWSHTDPSTLPLPSTWTIASMAELVDPVTGG